MAGPRSFIKKQNVPAITVPTNGDRDERLRIENIKERIERLEGRMGDVDEVLATDTSADSGSSNNLNSVQSDGVQFIDSDKLLARVSPGPGPGEEVDFSDAAQGLVDDLTYEDMRVTLGLEIGVDVQAWDSKLDAFSSFDTLGILVQTSIDAFAARTITGDSTISVTNGSGVSGNPTLTVLDSPLLQGQNGAYYLARANHTGTQLSTTISDFNEAAQDAVGGILTDTATVDFTYNDGANTITAAVLDSPLLQGQNSAFHLDRTNHTGTQLSTTISDFTEAAQDAVGATLTDTATLDLTYNDGANTISGAVLDSPLLQGQNSAYHLARANHTGTQDASTVDFTPTTLADWGGVDPGQVDDALDYLAANIGGGGYSDEQAQDAVGTILVDSATVDFTYSDATPSITAAVLDSPLLGGQNSAYHLDRTNHTGTQASTTISDFTEASQDAVGAMVDDTATATLTYADATPALTVDVLDSPLLGGQNSGYHLARANHTGSQTASTISDFDEAAQDAVGTILTDSSTVDFTYTDGGPTISAAVLDSPLLGGQNSAYHLARGNHTGTQLAATISDFSTAVTTVGNAVYQPLDADLTNIAGLVDPNADRILFWDDSAGAYAYLTVGTNLTITGTTLDASGGGGGAVSSVTGTANEVDVSPTTGATVVSLPSALTFTGKTVTGGTFASGAFNGTLGATTPSTVVATQAAINGAASTDRELLFQTAGVNRWSILADDDPEAGSDAGSDLRIDVFTDGGIRNNFARLVRDTGGPFNLFRDLFMGGNQIDGLPGSSGNGEAVRHEQLVALSGVYQPLDADLTSWAGVTRAAGFDTFVATPSSTNLAALVTGETGSGALVFGTGPTITGGALNGTLGATTPSSVAATSGAFSGNLTVGDGTAQALITINADDAQTAEVRFQDESVLRYAWTKAAANDFHLNYYNTSGVFVDRPFSVADAGAVTFGRAVAFGANAITGSAAAFTGGSFSGGVFNGTLGATTPATVAATNFTMTGAFLLSDNGAVAFDITTSANSDVPITLSDLSSAWSFGLDNSDSNAFVISSGTGLGTNNVARWSTTNIDMYGEATFTSSASGAFFAHVNTATSGPTTGAFFQAIVEDGAAPASGDRLGAYFLGGNSSTTATATRRNTAGMVSLATEAWVNGVGHGCDLQLQTTAIGSTVRTTRVTIDEVSASFAPSVYTEANGTATTARFGRNANNGLFFGTNEVAITANGVERFRVTSDGRLYGTALHNNAGAVTGTTNQYMASGTYTPTLTNTTNIAASSITTAWQWIRVGNVVTVSGHANADPTTASTASTLGISLPIASNFAAAGNAGGQGVRIKNTTAVVSGWVEADPTNDRALLRFFGDADVANLGWSIQFQYVIL